MGLTSEASSILASLSSLVPGEHSPDNTLLGSSLSYSAKALAEELAQWESTLSGETDTDGLSPESASYIDQSYQMGFQIQGVSERFISLMLAAGIDSLIKQLSAIRGYFPELILDVLTGPGSGIMVKDGPGSIVMRTLQGPAAGVIVTNGTGISGDPTISLANDLAEVEALGSTGIAVRAATDTWTTRTLTGPVAGLTVSNGDGVSGNPTITLADDLAALEGLSSTGLVVRTGTSTFTNRAISGPAAGLSVSNGDGVAGNPTIALANDLGALEALSTTGVARRTASDTWVLNTVSELLDLIGSTRGSILYRGASGWAILTPGTATHVLTSNGAGADPSYQAAAVSYTDENAQDAIATMLSSTEFTYSDGTPSVRMANKVVGILREIIQPAATYPGRDTRPGGSTPAENFPVFNFDPTNDEYLDFHYTLSPLYNGNGLTVRIGWAAATATSGNVIWRAAVRASPDDAEDMDSSHTYDYNSVTAATASAAGETVYDEITFTSGSDMDSLAAGEDFILRISRNASSASDTMTTSDAQLLSVVIRET